jgi:PAS domain S-box-containing protein
MTSNYKPESAPDTVRIPRGTLRSSWCAPDRDMSLVRSKDIESSDESSLEIPSPLSDVAKGQPIRVLHVDDNPDITEVTSVFLEDLDERFEVMTETTVVEALNTLENTKVDCIISDYQMPTTDGLEFLQIVRDRHPDIPFILFTGKGSEEIASEAIAAGVTDYVQKGGKSDRYDVLSNRVQNAVDRYRTQQQFWDALSWYQQLVEQNIAGVFVVQDGQIAYVNEKFAEIFGYTQSELIGKSPTSFVVSEQRDAVNECLTSGGRVESFEQEVTGKRRDGKEMPIEIHGGPVEYNGDEAILGILRDRSNRE